MSKNRRKNQNTKAALTEEANHAGEKVTQTDAVKAKPSALAFRINTLKKHWWAVGIIALLSIGAFGAGLKYLEDDAARVMAERSKATNLKPANEGLLSKINPFVSAPMPAPTPQLSKEYIYAGSKLLAVEDANASAVPPADLAVWRPSTGVWWMINAGTSQQAAQGWGSSGDTPAPGDYDGDGKTDFCVFRASAATWYMMRNIDGGAEYYYFGQSGDIPVPADYDGDGKTDAALYRPTNGVWYIRQSSTAQIVSTQFGATNDEPVPADYDGDGKADIALWREDIAPVIPNVPTFYVYRSSDATVSWQAYGIANDVPAPADYDGDGKADFSVRRGSSWYVLKSSDSQTLTYNNWGFLTDIEVPNDYDGDGKADIAVWRPSNGTWYIQNSSGNPATRTVQFGASGDVPVPAFYRR